MADLLKVMEREMLCSEHAAQCWLAAGRRQRAARKLGEEASKATLLDPCKLTPGLDAAAVEYLDATEENPQPSGD